MDSALTQETTAPIVPKLTLPALLSRLHEAENGLAEYTAEDEQELLVLLKHKVDSYHHVVTAYEREIAWFDSKIKQATEIKKRLAATLTRIEEFAGRMFHENGILELNGVEYMGKLKYSEFIETDTPTPDEETRKLFPDLVRSKTTHDWNKVEIKSALKAGADLPFAKIGQKPKVDFKERRI
jgi:hypothetical protein